jgi:hypothetical protein
LPSAGTVKSWSDKSVIITVDYHDGKTIEKEMHTRVPPWQLKARDWLAWLRWHVGW